MSDTTRKWFVLSAGHVEGPLTPSEIDERAPSLSEPLIWGRGLAEWMPPASWKEALQKQGSKLSELIPFDEASWKFRAEGHERGPFTYSDLLDAIKNEKDPSGIEIWGPDSQGWTEIYNVQKIVDELGITRRAHQRVPMMGNLLVTGATEGGVKQLRVISISEGGLGLNEAPPAALGQSFQATLKSPHLYSEIPCTCEVVYSADGAAGLRFTYLPAEGKAAIIEYVNKFRNLGER